MTYFPARMLRFYKLDFLSKVGPSKLLVWVTLGFGAMAFLVSELMHYLLVPDLGRQAERMVAEGVSALIVGCLATKLLSSALERRRTTIARLQVIEEMNHHIRNALAAISLSTYTIQNHESILTISEGLKRIEWTLREILPRDSPVSEEERNRLFFYFQWRKKHG